MFCGLSGVGLFKKIIESHNGLGWKIPWKRSSSSVSPLWEWTSSRTGPRASPNMALNTSRDMASTASLGKLFQCLTTLTVKT